MSDLQWIRNGGEARTALATELTLAAPDPDSAPPVAIVLRARIDEGDMAGKSVSARVLVEPARGLPDAGNPMETTWHNTVAAAGLLVDGKRSALDDSARVGSLMRIGDPTDMEESIYVGARMASAQDASLPVEGIGLLLSGVDPMVVQAMAGDPRFADESFGTEAATLYLHVAGGATIRAEITALAVGLEDRHDAMAPMAEQIAPPAVADLLQRASAA